MSAWKQAERVVSVQRFDVPERCRAVSMIVVFLTLSALPDKFGTAQTPDHISYQQSASYYIQGDHGFSP
jgi:hypothetical protein